MSKEYTIILFKPDAYRRKLVKPILIMCLAEDLKIAYHKKMWLTEEMMRTYQPILNQMPYFWQCMFINVYLAAPTDVYLLKGEDAINKTTKIKTLVRHQYVKGHPQMTPFNLMHSSTSHEDLVLNVLALIPEKINLVLRK